MARRQKKTIWKLLQGKGITLAAVVMLTVSAGAYALPQIFAATAADLVVSSISATPSNTASYAITFRWTGRNNTGHWQVLIYKGSTLISNANQETGSRAITATCGTSYTVKVRAVGPHNNVSAYKQASTSTRCPSASWSSFAASGNNVKTSWASTSGFAQSYRYYLKTGSGGYVASTTSATSRTISGACKTTYSAYLVPSAGGQNGAATPVKSATTAGCPAPIVNRPPAPTPTPAPAAPPKASTGTPKRSSPNRASPGSPAAPAAPAAPAMPENFSAEISSQKVIGLVWEAAANADHYLLLRSTDNVEWREIANTKETTYNDELTDFDTTYYYQLIAVGADGQKSAVASAQATTEPFTTSGDTISSADKKAEVVFPSGAIEGEYSCTLKSKATKAATTDNLKLVLGPYALSCVTDDGAVVNSFDAPVNVTLKLAGIGGNYQDIGARVVSDNKWKYQRSFYDEKTQKLTFTLTSADTFAAFGKKKSGALTTVAVIFFIILLIAAAVFAYLFWRRRSPRSPENVQAVQAELTAEQEFQQALAAPDCTHLGMAQQVIPSSQGCYECEQNGTHWKSLRICLICGHVGCSDDSPEQHSLKHYRETGHPLIYDYADPNGNSIGWCYIDQTYI